VRPLPIPHFHDWRTMEVCLINFNKSEDDVGCLTFCNILKWSATVYGKLLKGCVESIVSSITVLKILYTLVVGPVNVEALGFSL
jgi:hypothetical protein